MFENNKNITISGKVFDKELFDKLLIQFKEAFSHSSSSVEKAFEDLDNLNNEIELKKDTTSKEIYDTLDKENQREILNTTKQMILYLANRNLILEENYSTTNQEEINKIYEQKFSFFDKEIPYFLVFDEDNKFNSSKTFYRIHYLFNMMYERKNAYDAAYNIQKDNLDAFDYAMTMKELKIPDIIEINNIILKSNPDKVEGFKRTNNGITGATFIPTDKKNVPYEMQRLLYDYKNNFGEEILDYNEFGISQDEKNERLQKIFEKEALFHIRFIRIHPFSDGNGRTGRIILNHNLLSQNLAPVLITNIMSKKYKECINDFNVKELATLLMNNYSQQITIWVSQLKTNGKEKSLNNEELAEIIGYEQPTISNHKR